MDGVLRDLIHLSVGRMEKKDRFVFSLRGKNRSLNCGLCEGIENAAGVTCSILAKESKGRRLRALRFCRVEVKRQ